MSRDDLPRQPIGPLRATGPLQAIDYALGEGSTPQRRAFQDELREDLEVAADLAETDLLLDELRELGADIQPSGRVAGRLRIAARDRLELRGTRRPGLRQTLGVALRVAAVALVWFGVSWATFGAGLRSLWLMYAEGEPVVLVGELTVAPARPPAPRAGQRSEFVGERSSAALPVASPGFAVALERLAEAPRRDDFAGRLAAENLLAQLRREAFLRSSADTRAALRSATGTPDLEARSARVAAVVAARLRAEIERGAEADAEAVAYGLRGLVAAGSTAHGGPHTRAVESSGELLSGVLAQGEAVSADLRAVLLQALSELAVVEGGSLESLVAVGAEELAREILRVREDGARPVLLRWSTPAARLAEACRLLELAPAFGAGVELAGRARRMLAAHLQERVDIEPDLERPRLLVAQSYGCGDLVGRRDLDHRLQLWRARHLLPDHVAVQQLAWSRYPVRAGWAEFQFELRGLAGRPTPGDLTGAGAFLLTLCTNLAAPGAAGAAGAAGDGL